MDDRIHLTVDEARELAQRALRGIGYDAEEAGIVAEHVLDAALCGYEYSGLPKILNVAEHPRQKRPRHPMRAVRETDVSAMFDGGNNVGMLAMYRATEVAIAKAQKHGFAVIGVNNSWVSGRGALYVEMVARANLVGIHTVSSTPHVAPLGGTKAVLGTNPMSFGFPTAAEPVVIDMGTSAFMSTDLLFRQRRGEFLPAGVAIDAEGVPTRDPAAALGGAILPFGGYKGYVLAFAMQAFGVFAGSGTDVEKSYGYLMIAMKPDLLVPLDEFRRDMTAMIERIKATPRAPGVDEIRIPSERAFRERERNLAAGIEIDRKIYDRLVALAGAKSLN
ncbi:MAG TPA: Ldh family oxidoreductase [Burkholderiales bacterium]|nr:Ldh family oxidoreductase [Burkholderiales bacterium]